MRTDQARQALGATGARQQAEVDFRQAEAGSWLGDAVTAGQRQLQATTQGKFADGGNQRFVQLRQAHQQIGEGWLGMGSRAAKLADIGPGAECQAFAVEDDGAHGRVGRGRFAGLQQRCAQRLAEGIDRGAGQPDQGQVVFDSGVDQVAHRGSLVLLDWKGRPVQNQASCMSKQTRLPARSKLAWAGRGASSQSMK
ncbi:hypothetical protein D3C86_1377820 [compost metagenome]